MTETLAQQYVKHIESIIKTFQDNGYKQYGQVDNSVAYGILARGKTSVEKITGPDSHYTKDVLEIAVSDQMAVSYKAELIVGILEALKSDIKDGYMANLSELIRGDTFNSYLDMAEYLLEQGFKDSAAVIAGSTFEAHLKQLCLKHGISTTITGTDGRPRPKSAAQINQDLAKVAYSSYDSKQITVWQALRNDAAHGNYHSYTEKQVGQFVDWIRDFVARLPA